MNMCLFAIGCYLHGVSLAEHILLLIYIYIHSVIVDTFVSVSSIIIVIVIALWRQRNMRHVHYQQHNRIMHVNTRLHDSRRNKKSKNR